MRRFLLLLTLVGALLAGCGTRQTPSDAPAPAATVDVASLPPSVDPATVSSLMGSADVLVLDVREPSEYAAGHIPGVTLIPMAEVESRLSEIPTDKPVIVTCRSGNRSAQVADFLRSQGYTNIHNMDGGILSWQAAGLPIEK